MSRFTDEQLDEYTARVAIAALNYLRNDKERFVAAVRGVFSDLEAATAQFERNACAQYLEHTARTIRSRGGK